MRKTLLSLVMIMPCMFAQDGANCKDVGGGILTNFVDQTTTLGTATGDLAGGLGVDVLSVTAGANGSTIFHNHHHWVTVSGDTITLADADATAYPTPIQGLYGASYKNGIEVTGGTGRFTGATGTLTAFGAVNLGPGQIVLRYAGQVCFQSAATH
ncbi:MAG: hypothetical protein WAM39_20160 [Bryobacteraceae bacterium]